MNENYIKKLIKLVEESEIEALEVSSWGRKIKITQRMGAVQNGSADAHTIIQTAPAVRNAPAPVAGAAPVAETAESADSNYVEIKSPMVGTFYSSPAPDADPYVSANQKITKGQVVCIVEAMKLMNEIESEVSGRIAKVLVENAQPVEFGQVIYLIEPD